MDGFLELALPIISMSFTRNHIEFIENESNESHLWVIWWMDSYNWFNSFDGWIHTINSTHLMDGFIQLI